MTNSTSEREQFQNDDDMAPRPPTVNTGRGRCIHNVPICGDCEITRVFANVAEAERGRNDAATSMRELCVEKVKSMQRDYGEREQIAISKKDEYAAAYLDGKETAANEIATALQSLTLEQEQK